MISSYIKVRISSLNNLRYLNLIEFNLFNNNSDIIIIERAELMDT